MENLIKILANCPLFSGINEPDLQALLGCLSATRRQYKKDQHIFIAGEQVKSVGIVLTGKVHVVQQDFWGRQTIIANVDAGGMFGEAFSCAQLEKIPVSVVAAQACEVLMLDYKKIISSCSSSCVFHTALIQNMLNILANKNVMQMQKMELLTKPTTREKLLAYLSMQAQQAASTKFDIPFNRQQLADYLSVERSAMSNELSKMQKDGILICKKSSFELL